MQPENFRTVETEAVMGALPDVATQYYKFEVFEVWMYVSERLYSAF